MLRCSCVKVEVTDVELLSRRPLLRFPHRCSRQRRLASRVVDCPLHQRRHVPGRDDGRLAAGSSSLQADALDFLGDAANYAISLGVAGLALAWRARAALLKGASLGLLGLWVLASTAWHAWTGTLPSAEVMTVVAVIALLANGGVALMLYRFRGGDANMRSVWICSRNDAVGQCCHPARRGQRLGSGQGWPDAAVALILAMLSVSGGWQIVHHARMELGHGANLLTT